jgi:hypothetical protein
MTAGFFPPSGDESAALDFPEPRVFAVSFQQFGI